jgi:hypothetical protein
LNALNSKIIVGSIFFLLRKSLWLS